MGGPDDSLAVSQFTLLANTRKGHKPDFHGAAKPEEARLLYEHFVSKVQNLYLAEKVKNGVFQAMMEVGLVNDGPVGVNYRSDQQQLCYELQWLIMGIGDSGNRHEPSKERNLR